MKPPTEATETPIDRQAQRLAEQQAKLDARRKAKIATASAKADADMREAMRRAALLAAIDTARSHVRGGRDAEALEVLRVVCGKLTGNA